MPYARNALDGRRVYFEDDDGNGQGVLFSGGFMEPVDLVRDSPIAQGLPVDEFRHIYIDHRGHGRSDKPHDSEAYAMPLRVADVIAVLDELGIDGAHFVGVSWGGRLGFGIGQHAPNRVRSLVIGGQQPYRWPDSPLTQVVTDGLAASQTEGIEALVRAFEAYWVTRFPEERRLHYLENDPVALQAAWNAVLAEGAISKDLGAWLVRCLIFMGDGDADFIDQARRAASEIPDAQFISLRDLDHLGAHTTPDHHLLDMVLRLFREHSPTDAADVATLSSDPR